MSVQTSSRPRVEGSCPISALADGFLGDGLNGAFHPAGVKR